MIADIIIAQWDKYVHGVGKLSVCRQMQMEVYGGWTAWFLHNSLILCTAEECLKRDEGGEDVSELLSAQASD